jgi:hypothetical protein
LPRRQRRPDILYVARQPEYRYRSPAVLPLRRPRPFGIGNLLLNFGIAADKAAPILAVFVRLKSSNAFDPCHRVQRSRLVDHHVLADLQRLSEQKRLMQPALAKTLRRSLMKMRTKVEVVLNHRTITGTVRLSAGTDGKTTTD